MNFNKILAVDNLIFVYNRVKIDLFFLIYIRTYYEFSLVSLLHRLQWKLVRPSVKRAVGTFCYHQIFKLINKSNSTQDYCCALNRKHLVILKI